MATMTSPLQRKLKKVLCEQFPAPATVKLQNHNGIFGVITSERFAEMEPLDRQKWITDILKSNLTPEERWQIQIIVAVTPDEGTGYLASPDR